MYHVNENKLIKIRIKRVTTSLRNPFPLFDDHQSHHMLRYYSQYNSKLLKNNQISKNEK